ncbi:hypothetical protein WAI453_009618 [Rhynchosporium graminicola]
MGSIAFTPPEEELHLKESSFDVPCAPYPQISTILLPTSVSEIRDIVDKSIEKLNTALQAESYGDLHELMAKTSYWRDHLGLSNTKFSTLNGAGEVISLIQAESKSSSRRNQYSQNGVNGTSKNGCNITSITITGTPELTSLDPNGKVTCILAKLAFTTQHGSGVGNARWIPDVESGDEWRIYTLFTTLTDLSATPFLTGLTRPETCMPAGRNFLDWRAEQKEFLHEDPAVIIVGAGHSGLMTAARLKMMGVRTLVVDCQERTGDSWRKRYRDLVMHDPCWMNEVPYLKYPPSWPVLIPKDKMADFLEYYENALDLDVWNSTQLIYSTWDDVKKVWTVMLERNVDGKVSRSNLPSPITRLDYSTIYLQCILTWTGILHPRHVIQATGLNGEPRTPSVPGLSTFNGPILHSTQYTTGTQFANKRVIVVGIGTSGHDISQNLYKAGADVTIVQRSPTFVLSLASTHQMIREIYNDGTDTEGADVKIMSFPTTLFKRVGGDTAALLAESNREVWEGLEKVGFKTISKGDLPSLLSLTIQRAGGFYIDIGCSSLIASSAIRCKFSPSISHLTQTGMVFEDGEEIQADAIVFATGYSNGRVRTRKVFGDEVADSIEPIWGFDDMGEVRGVWKRGGKEGFWVAAGSFWLSRYYSRLLALQIKMCEQGLVGL